METIHQMSFNSESAFSVLPLAMEIEKQNIRWLAQIIGYPANSGGLFVSEGNMANLIGFLTARRAKYSGNVQEQYLSSYVSFPVASPWGMYTGNISNGYKQHRQLMIYCAKDTHPWVAKAASLFGHSKNTIRWIEVNQHQQMDDKILQAQLQADLQQGHFPFLVIGNASSVNGGSLASLSEIASVCKKNNLWFHIDATGVLPTRKMPIWSASFDCIKEADSIALDLQKSFSPALASGCILVRNAQHL
jgi:aromatic-L-amino-acid/L-tryptophan decarboxylase